jgi:hypothetical protein
MKGTTGYATLSSPLGHVKETDTFTCGHCQTIVHIRPKEPLENMGGRCGMCDTLICPACVTKGNCDPFEEKLKRFEHKYAARRWY